MMEFEKAIPVTVPGKAIDLLADHTPLSRARLKKVMTCGAVWWRQPRGEKRLRRATQLLKAGDTLTIYYDERVIDREPPQPACVANYRDYSLWYKPAGLLAQGTRYGDHCSLLRLVEIEQSGHGAGGQVKLVHRLDRETDGLMLVAHTAKGASQLSLLFQQRKIYKRYRAWVQGELAQTLQLTTPVDGKPAHTQVTPINQMQGATLVDVVITTGRKHQIRRHLSAAGYPVLGDPRYGEGNGHPDGLQLSAVELRFHCPFARQERVFAVPEAVLQRQMLGAQPLG